MVMALSKQKLLHYSLLMRVLPYRPLQPLFHALTIPRTGLIVMVRNILASGIQLGQGVLRMVLGTQTVTVIRPIKLVVPVEEEELELRLLPRLQSHRLQVQPQASFPLPNPHSSHLPLHPRCALTPLKIGLMPMVLLSTAIGTVVTIDALYLEITLKTWIKLQIRRAVRVAAEMTLPHLRHLQISPFHLLLLRHQTVLPR
mmetsp:Transcript_15602/g.23276  ORF Transcript_15602/g.23276 Transcript_15602/m.23276 type:complete len:200 (+) Transcript_15602:1055-1654(+)